MKTLSILRACVLVLAAYCISAHAQADKPGAYTSRHVLQVQPGSGLQRTEVPPSALAALQTTNYADLRVFNGAGQAVPIAVQTLAAPASQPLPAPVVLPAYPILGGQAVQGASGVALRIEESGGKRVIQMDSAAPADAKMQQLVLGALIDTRALTLPMASVEIEADLPAARPVAITVAASKDLKSWRTLVDAAPVFRFEGAGAPSQTTLALTAPVKVEGEYLRLSWPTDVPLLLRAVRIQPAHATAPPPARSKVALNVAAPASPHEITMRLPFATPLAALEIAPPTANTLLPVRVYGRNQSTQPWQLLASTVVYRITMNGKESVSGAAELFGASVRELKLEADKATQGFTAAPQITALLAPVQITFVASGAAPFTLAAGLADAPSTALPLASLIPGYTPGMEDTLPLARTAAAQNSSSASASVDVAPSAKSAASTH
ncbi:MAG: DUF3999 family protein, partial [Burkholderiaceae bacterium]